MTDIIERAEAALEGVTDGPWVVVGYGNIHYHVVGEQPPIAKVWNTANSQFVVAARSLVPELVTELKATRAENERLKAWNNNQAYLLEITGDHIGQQRVELERLRGEPR